jgi:hypothetical protein
MGTPQGTRRWLSLFSPFLFFFSVFGFIVFGFGSPPLAVTPSSHGASGTRGSGIGNGTEKLWALVLLDHHDLSSRNSKTVLSPGNHGKQRVTRDETMAFAGIPGALSFSFLSRLSLSVSPWIYFLFPLDKPARSFYVSLLFLHPTQRCLSHFLFISFLPHQLSPLDGWNGVPYPPRSRSCAVQ